MRIGFRDISFATMVVAIITSFFTNLPAFAETINSVSTKTVLKKTSGTYIPNISDSNNIHTSLKVQPDHGGGMVSWEVIGTSPSYQTQDSWKFGTAGYGPSTLGLSQTIGVSNDVTGSVDVPVWDISSSVGFDVSYSYQSQASYQVNVPGGREYEIEWANRYMTTPVKEAAVYGGMGGSKILETAECYAHRWLGFVYRYVPI